MAEMNFMVRSGHLEGNKCRSEMLCFQLLVEINGQFFSSGSIKTPLRRWRLREVLKKV